MSRIITSEHVRAEFLKEGYTIPVEWEYVNSRTKIPFICDNGHKHSITRGNWSLGSRCRHCSYNIPSSRDIRDSFYKEGYIIPEDWEYVNCDTNIPFTCSKGHSHSITRSSWRRGRRCRYCGHNVPTSEDVRELFLKEGYIIPVEWEYVNNHTNIPFTCSKGHSHNITRGNWSLGTRCVYCGRAKANLKWFGHKKLYLYWVRIYDWIHNKETYKFGITSHKNIEGRFNKSSKQWGFKFEILDRTEASNEQICMMEVDLLYEVKDYRTEWVPKEFHGHTECFVCSESSTLRIWNKIVNGW